MLASLLSPVYRAVRAVAMVMAILGGVVLTALILMVCLSILGRTATSVLHSGFMQANLPALANWLLATGVGPIRGDYELVESGMAFAIFAFLSWCHLTGGHATVDLLVERFPARLRRWIEAAIALVFAVVLVVIALKLHEGMDAQMRRRTTTFLLQYPVWWSYLAALIPAYIAAGTASYVALLRGCEAVLDRPLIAAGAGDEA